MLVNDSTRYILSCSNWSFPIVCEIINFETLCPSSKVFYSASYNYPFSKIANSIQESILWQTVFVTSYIVTGLHWA